MTLGAFALKKSKKKTLVASAGFDASLPNTSQTVDKVFVTDFDPNALPALTQTGSKPLVIPLLQTNTWNITKQPPKHDDEKNDQNDDENNQNNDEKNIIEVNKTQVLDASLDQQVAAAICAEVTQVRPGSSMSHLVIPLADKREKKRAELFQDGAKRVQDQQQKPLLQQNVVPGLDTLQDVADKYRHDVALRPDALDVLSDVYESVPVEAFGAALLRGMGWKGDETMDDEEQEALQPRHKLLGLGATKRPTLAGESQRKKKKKKVKRKTEDGDGRSEIEDEDQRSAGTRSMDRERRCSRGRTDRRKRSRSESRGRGRDRSRDRDRGRDRDCSRRSRSRSCRSRSDRRSRRR